MQSTRNIPGSTVSGIHMPKDQLEQAMLQAFKEMSPSTAYLIGFDDYAGKFFIPSKANITTARRKLRSLRRRATTDLQRKLLDSAAAVLAFDEPQPVLEDITGAIFSHLVKEGVDDEHMLSLLECASQAIDAAIERFEGREEPVAVKALVLYRYPGVKEILDTVKGESTNRRVKQACEALKAKVADYAALFELDGFGRGEFDNVEKIFKKYGFDLGREKSYPDVLRKAFDYEESPEELEKNAIAWIDEELPSFRAVTEKLAKIHGCKPVPEEVEDKLDAKMSIDPKRLIRTTLALRKVVQKFVNEDVVRINPKYRTKVIETPRFLTGTIPSGAAQFFDTYTRNPFQVFFQTTDPKRDPSKAIANLLNLLAHEEYGHCVNHSNSVVGFVGKVGLLQLYPGLPTSGPVTEGLSLNREIEFFEASKKLETKRRLTKNEKEYVKLTEKYGGLKMLNLELEFWTRRWRLTRFLRVVGDVRVNTGKQGLMEFVDWANDYTGVPRASMYFQLFPAHEGMFPGYATSYAVVGQEIRAMEKKITDDKKRIKFSTYLCSVGFPPRSMYRRMLEEYAEKLR
jgi:hypothetical protein